MTGARLTAWCGVALLGWAVQTAPAWAQSGTKPVATKVALQAVVARPAGPSEPTGPAAEMLAQERELEAIRKALLQTALNAPMRVRSMSWIDGEGRLQENAQFTSDAKVRGVRVESYLTDDKQQDFRVHVDATQVKLPMGVGAKPSTDEATCAAHNARWRQRVQVNLQWTDGWAQLPQAVAQQLQMHTHTAWQQQTAAPAGRWLWQTQSHAAGSTYTQALLQSPSQRAEGRAQLTVAVVQPAGQPVTWIDRVTFNQFRPAPPAPVLRWRLHVQLQATQQERAFEWDMPLVYGPLSLHGGSGAGTFSGWNLPKDAAQQLQQWTRWIDAQTLCDVVAYPVQQVGGEWRVMVDPQLGARPGDRFLIVDRAAVPQRMLEPGALASLAIAEVGATARESSQIRWLAGPTPQPGRDWVALPL
jgi:hypothetical protein